MNKNVIIWIIVAVILVVGWRWSRQRTVPASNDSDVVNTTEEIQVVSDDANQIAVISGNLFYSPDKLTLTQNEPITLTFTNTGFHTFTVDELGIDEPISGSSSTIKFTPTKTGTFEYYCAVPGHREGGMVGTVTVQ